MLSRVFAAPVQIGGSGPNDIPFSPAKSFPTIGALVSTITSNAFVIAGVLAFIFIIIGGFAIISAGGSGDPKRMEQGKKTLTYAIAGLILVVFSYWIIQLLGLILGFNPLKLYP